MIKLPNHTALKEWASVIAALGAGEQILLLRKGGIADPRFGVEANRFYLFPTYLHQREKQFKPEFQRYFVQTDRSDGEPNRVAITHWAEVARTFQVDDLRKLLALDPFLIFLAKTIEQRYRFRPDQAVHVLAVRAYRLREAVEVENRSEYGGCRSWISLEEEIAIDDSQPALSESDFARRLADVNAVLDRARERQR